MIPSEQIIAAFLMEKMVGTDPAIKGLWPVFWGRLPNDPDEAIAVQRDIAPTQGKLHRIAMTVHQEGIQVRTRSKKYEDAQEKILTAFDELDRITNFEISVGTKRYRIQGVSFAITPFFIGPDPNNRVNFVLNGRAAIKEI